MHDAQPPFPFQHANTRKIARWTFTFNGEYKVG